MSATSTVTYIDPSSNQCQVNRSATEQACTGYGVDPSAVYNQYATEAGFRDCVAVFSGFITQGQGGGVRTTCDLNQLFTVSQATQKFQAGQGADALVQSVLEVCTDPSLGPSGVCQNYLATQMCPAFSYNQIVTTPSLSSFCGCYTQDPQSSASIAQTCQPQCHRVDTVQPVSENGVLQVCTQDVCVISDVAINLTQSTAGTVNFNTVCLGCSADGGCICIVDSQSAAQAAGVTENFNLYCGPGSQCFTTGADGALVPISCSQYASGTDPADSGTNVLAIVVLVFLLLVLFVIFAIALYLVTTKRY